MMTLLALLGTGLIAVGALRALGGGESPPPPPPPLWQAGFEAGLLAKWEEAQEEPTGHRATSDAAVAREGKRSARFELRGEDRLEADGTARQQLRGLRQADGRPVRFGAGQDLFFGLSLRLDRDYPTDEERWQVLVSWKDPGAGQGPVKLSTSYERDRFRLEGPGGDTVAWRGPLVRGQWVDFVIRVRFSPDPRTGFVEVWYRPPWEERLVRQRLDGGGTRHHMATMEAGTPSSELKIGLYRDPAFTAPSVAWFDAVRIADAFEVAAPRHP